MDEVVLDTDILSEVLKRRNANVAVRARGYLQQHSAFTISALTVMELVKGYEKAGRGDELLLVLIFLRTQRILPFDTETAELAGRIHGRLQSAGEPLGRVDPMIAATAILRGLPLVTGNSSHYWRVQALGYALTLQDWRD